MIRLIGFSDGNIYIFSTAANRKANASIMGSFQCAVAKKIAEVEAVLAAQVKFELMFGC